MTTLARAASLAALLIAGPALAGAELPRFRPDGLHPEWAGASPLAADPPGDASGAFDVRALYADSRGSTLFVRFDIGATLNIQEGSALDGALRLEIGSLPGAQRLTVDFRARRAYLNGNFANVVPWTTLQYIPAPTFAADEHEVSLNLATFGVGPGSTITLDFSGSDALAAPASFTFSAPASEAARRAADRSAGALRVASLNTFQSGMLSASQYNRFERLFKATRPDVIALQEEYNSSAAQIRTRLNAFNIHGDGAPWNVHKVGDNVVAAREAMSAMPHFATGYAAAIVHHASGPILVLSIHPKCCGSIGSSEDVQRISQTAGMVRTIDEVRAGLHGPFHGAPVIVIGDWNLVGSRTPLDMLTNPSGPDLRWIMPPNLIGESVATWRGASSNFAPGVLDLVVYDDSVISHRNHFLVDTSLLNASELAALNLQAADSGASDHLLMIVDFAAAPACPADADFDGAVGFPDLNALLASFNCRGAGIPGDLDGDGDVDFTDLNLLLPSFNTSCPAHP